MEILSVIVIIMMFIGSMSIAVWYRNREDLRKKEIEEKRKKLYKMLDNHLDGNVPDYVRAFARQVDVDVDKYIENNRRLKHISTNKSEINNDEKSSKKDEKATTSTTNNNCEYDELRRF